MDYTEDFLLDDHPEYRSVIGNNELIMLTVDFIPTTDVERAYYLKFKTLEAFYYFCMVSSMVCDGFNPIEQKYNMVNSLWYWNETNERFESIDDIISRFVAMKDRINDIGEREDKYREAHKKETE